MERWIGSRSARGIVALAAGLVVLIGGLAKFRVAADERKANETKEESAPSLPTAPPKREALRYAGKNFDQWRIELETELKPEIRADGMTALAAFGANGYGSEAARTIIEQMRGYDLDTKNSKDQQVMAEAYEAISKIGPPAIPILWKSLSSDSDRIRRFACNYFQLNETHWQPPVGELLIAARHDDANVRKTALDFLENVKDKPKTCLPILLECLKDKESGVRAKAIDNLDKMRPEAKEVMSALSVALTDAESTVRSNAIRMTGHYGSQAKPVVPELLKALDKPLHSGDFVTIMDAFAAIGPDAKDALPKLRQLQEKPNMEVFQVVGCADYSKILDRTIKKLEGK